MLLIPFSDKPGTYKLFVVLENDNIERMKEADPAQITFPLQGFEDKRLKMMLLVHVSEEEKQHVLRLMQDGKPGEILQYLSRGFVFRPEAGDHDGPAVSLRTDRGERRQ